MLYTLIRRGLSQPPERLIELPELAEILGLGTGSTRAITLEPGFPPSVRLKGREVWRSYEVKAWIDALPPCDPSRPAKPPTPSTPDVPSQLLDVADLLKEHKDQRKWVVYFLVDAGQVVYVGQTVNLQSRLHGHRCGKERKEFDRVFFMPVEGERDAAHCEKLYIRKLKPKYNVAGLAAWRRKQREQEAR